MAALVTSVSVNAATDTTKTNVTPKGMSCREFVDLNPQTMAPVAFWVLNEDEDFKGGDYVDFEKLRRQQCRWPLSFVRKTRRVN